MKKLLLDNVEIIRESELKGDEIIIVMKLGKAVGVISKDNDGYYGMIENMHSYKKKSFSEIIMDEKFKNCEFVISE